MSPVESAAQIGRWRPSNIVGYHQVELSIVVVVADGHTQSIHADRQASLGGHIGERPVVVVVVKLECRGSLAMSRPVFPVDEQNVGITVVIVIDESAARTQSFRKILST